MATNFTIALPSYKTLYLRECIESILGQTYPDFEVVIVNDASPEDMDSVVAEFHDERIRYYKNEKNFGAYNVVGNWNRCLEYAKGDYIICMGDDDKLLPNCLEDYAKLIEKYPGLGVYHGWTEIIDENSRHKEVTAARPEFEGPFSMTWHRWNGNRQQFIGDFLFDTKQLRDAGGFYFIPLAWGSDDITATELAAHKGIANTQTLVFQYRVSTHTISMSGGKEDEKMQCIDKVRQWYKKFFTTATPLNAIEEKYRADSLRTMGTYFRHRFERTIGKDIHNNGYLRLFHWQHELKKYGLSDKSLVMALKDAFTFK